MADDTLLPSRQIVQAGRRHNSTRMIDRQEGPSTSASTWRGGLDAQARLLGLQPANGQHLQGLRHSKPNLRTGLAPGTWENRLRAAWIEMIEGGRGRGDGNIPQNSRLSYHRVSGKQYQLLTCTDKKHMWDICSVPLWCRKAAQFWAVWELTPCQDLFEHRVILLLLSEMMFGHQRFYCHHFLKGWRRILILKHAL